jgi:2-methylisocitrate lyase-like PEP mutase family enzyme
MSDRLPAHAAAPVHEERESRCERLRSLHVPGAPLLLPNAWDVASARAVTAAGFPVVATSSGAVARSLGYEDHERAPRDEMLAVATRIARGVDVPVTVDLEAGYSLEPAELVDTLATMGVAGCNLEDTDHANGRLREMTDHAAWLRAVRDAASARGYGLVINARIDVFLAGARAQPEAGHQIDHVDEALRRAHAYAEAGADCVFPIVLWEPDALAAFVAQAPTAVNILRIPPAPSEAELADLGVARVSYGHLLHSEAMDTFASRLHQLAADGPILDAPPAAGTRP